MHITARAELVLFYCSGNYCHAYNIRESKTHVEIENFWITIQWRLTIIPHTKYGPNKYILVEKIIENLRNYNQMDPPNLQLHNNNFTAVVYAFVAMVIEIGHCLPPFQSCATL